MRARHVVKDCGFHGGSTVYKMEGQSKGRRHGTSIRIKRTSKNTGSLTVQEQVQEEGADGVGQV